MLDELLDELGVPASRALMIGDTEYDMAMARALDMPRVGVSYGVHESERLAAFEPLHIAHDIDGLFDWLDASVVKAAPATAP